MPEGNDQRSGRTNSSPARERQGLTYEQSVEFSDALNGIAARLERAAVVLARVIELSKAEAPRKNLHLTPRELEILSCLAEGRSNGEIATKCWISANTVKFHLKNLFRKLEIRDRGQAMMIARSITQGIGQESHGAGPGTAGGDGSPGPEGQAQAR